MNEWLNTPVSADASRRVHSGVMRRIRRGRQTRLGAGVLPMVAALTFTFWPALPELETLTLTMPQPLSAPAWVPPRPTKPPIILAQTLAKATSRPAERITIYTDDPDVVIVLVADGGEE